MNQSTPKLAEKLKSNTQLTLLQHEKLMDTHFTLLKDLVVEMLEQHSHKSINSFLDIEIGNLYVDNYYEPNGKDTPLGRSFRNDFGHSPSADELQDLTHTLEKYLLSQKLSVFYLSHCNMSIRWD
jgi:hypothetical protein